MYTLKLMATAFCFSFFLSSSGGFQMGILQNDSAKQELLSDMVI